MIPQINSHNNGYYVCDNKIFTSKVNALFHSKQTKKPIEWIFHDSVYQSYDWSVEPTETLDQLYDRHSRLLREKYDYLILSYSGGSDCHNIVESFIRQGLHIDEILVNNLNNISKSVTQLNPTVQHASNLNAEHELQAVPRLRDIHKRIPRTKITVLDVSDVVLNAITDDGSWVFDKADHLGIGQCFRFNYFYFAELKKKFDHGSKIGIITGQDKPKTFIKDNHIHVFFIDTTANLAKISSFNVGYDNIFVELFYWGVDTAPIVCKQVHVIKHWLDANPRLQVYWRDATFENMRRYHEPLLKSVIYTTWDESWFQVEKSTSWWNTEFDTWFQTNPEFENKYKLWKQGLNWLDQQLGNEFVVKKNNQPDTFVKFTKTYQVAPMKPLRAQQK
jgi:hypothetical protein